MGSSPSSRNSGEIIMDFRACFVLALVETTLISILNPTHDIISFLGTDGIRVIVVLSVLQWVALKTYRIFIYPTFFSPLRNILGPKDNHFFLGQLVHLYRASTPIDHYVRWSSRWPDSPFIRYLTLANKEILLINTVEAHRQVLQTKCYDFIKPQVMERLAGALAGKGLLFAKNHEHKKQRRMILNIFSAPNIKKLIPTFQRAAEEMTIVIKGKLKEDIIGDIEFQEIFGNITLNAIGATALGTELENVQSAESGMGFVQYYYRMLSQLPLSALISFIHVYIPIRSFIPLEANLGYIRAMKGVHSIIEKCIEERIRDLKTTDREKAGESESRDLLTYMIEEQESNDIKLSIEDIRGHLQNFLAGGHETATTALSWATYILATRPDVQDKLRAEVIDNLGVAGMPSYAAIERLHYLNNFFEEVTRLYAPAPITLREAATDVVICGQLLPKGTLLVLSAPVTNRSTRIWGADALEFRPERWDSLTGDAATPYGTQTFANGPRMCIGRSYAVLIFKVMMIELLRNFRFSRSAELTALGDREPPVLNPSVTWRLKHGMTVHVEEFA
ncbi:cytochrome P450 [Hypomontagnella monticulosa]|nr:cytochrome P450 [Hypomontagnella monticulosa]